MAEKSEDIDRVRGGERERENNKEKGAMGTAMQ